MKVNVGKTKVMVFDMGESTTECDILIEEMFPKSYPVSLSGFMEGVSVPMGAARACTNSLCLSLCRALGWPRGVCLDRTTCFCWR
ncbi:hypothetical protein EVAR_50478_1 [Eumeta japonica]|uniref:Uncharacterized protein n=1 Tax=Eumeta variegata TaxID=151549 RepID=A0A4C1XUD9_EUMVA|nr:hypothetical protein EVAR_50478_1 [Eumeta japonica]